MPPISPKKANVQRVPVLDSFMTFRETGDGSPVVLLHGNPLSSRVWRDVLPQVAERARGLAPDLIGMGESGKPDSAYRFADHARYLDAWLDALALGDVVLVGYDWGGSLALDWAARHPHRVRGVVVLRDLPPPHGVGGVVAERRRAVPRAAHPRGWREDGLGGERVSRPLVV